MEVLLGSHVSEFLVFLVGLYTRIRKGPVFLRGSRCFSRLYLLACLHDGLPNFFLAGPLCLYGPLQLFFCSARYIVSGLPRSPNDRYDASSPSNTQARVAFCSVYVLQRLLYGEASLGLFTVCQVVSVCSNYFGEYPLYSHERASRTNRLFLFFYAFRCRGYVSIVFVSRGGVVCMSYSDFARILFSAPPTSLDL